MCVFVPFPCGTGVSPKAFRVCSQVVPVLTDNEEWNCVARFHQQGILSLFHFLICHQTNALLGAPLRNHLPAYKLIFLFFLQNAIVSFKELCGLSAVANLKQCILALSPRLTGPDNSPLLVFNLTEQYPNLEPQGLLPEVLKKVVTTYDMVSRCGCKELFGLEA